MSKSELLRVSGKLVGNQTNQEIIPAVSGKIISIVSARFTLAAVGSVKLLNKTAGTTLTPAFDTGSGLLIELKSARAQGVESIAETEVGDSVGVTTTGGGDLTYLIEYYTEP